MRSLIAFFLPLALVFSVFSVIFMGCSPAAEAATGAPRGKALLQENCGSCHAVGQRARSRHREAPPFRNVMRIYSADSLAEALGEGLVTGHPDMPEFVFKPEDVGAILDYLKTLK